MFEIHLVFAKTGQMRFISHLDLMRLFIRASRRAELPLKLSEGFSPHPKIIFKRALKLGVESENEEVKIILKEKMDLEKIKQTLQEQLPQGIEIKNAAYL